MANEDIRHAVRHARLELEMTQADLADQAGVSRQWIAGLESGRMANPRLGSISAVLEVLGLALVVQRVGGATPDHRSAWTTRSGAHDPRSPEGAEAVLQAVLDQSTPPAVTDAVQAFLENDKVLNRARFADVLDAIKADQAVDTSAIADLLDAATDVSASTHHARNRAETS